MKPTVKFWYMWQTLLKWIGTFAGLRFSYLLWKSAHLQRDRPESFLQSLAHVLVLPMLPWKEEGGGLLLCVASPLVWFYPDKYLYWFANDQKQVELLFILLPRQQKCATNGQLNVQKISWLSQNLPLYGVTNAHKTVLSLGSWCTLTVDARRTHIVHLTHKTKTAEMSKGLIVYFTWKLICWFLFGCWITTSLKSWSPHSSTSMTQCFHPCAWSPPN